MWQMNDRSGTLDNMSENIPLPISAKGRDNAMTKYEAKAEVLITAISGSMAPVVSEIVGIPGVGLFAACATGSLLAIYLRWRNKFLTGFGEMIAALLIGTIGSWYIHPWLNAIMGGAETTMGAAAFICGLGAAQIVEGIVDMAPSWREIGRRFVDAIIKRIGGDNT